ncbi:MAG: hypothetical protein HWQ35_17665 [Nostoc sp. NMS1]|uniref:hypothetical protein n=1 Tax=unclassified Nostoc TaxID=2593658 RepID=UPI0025F23515|nr:MULTISPECIES: hypothetical protein [unclassified Nostoc]MBN3908296.1 hypothetical protein [Nostoc sp. NMS1]
MRYILKAESDDRRRVRRKLYCIIAGSAVRLKSTKDYLQALGNDMGISISSLIIEIEGYGKEQGTWVNSAKKKASRKNILFF